MRENILLKENDSENDKTEISLLYVFFIIKHFPFFLNPKLIVQPCKTLNMHAIILFIALNGYLLLKVS